MNPNRNVVGWFEIYVQDMQRAKAFYQNTLEVKFERLVNPDLELWSFPGQPDNAGCSGALVRMEGKDSGTGGTIVYFSCDDCAATAERAVENGGRVQKPKISIGQYGFIALIYDTEDNVIGLHSLQ